jgi:hypothetical protein
MGHTAGLVALAERRTLFFVQEIETRLQGYPACSLVTTVARERLESYWPLTVANIWSTAVPRISVGTGDIARTYVCTLGVVTTLRTPHTQTN